MKALDKDRLSILMIGNDIIARDGSTVRSVSIGTHITGLRNVIGRPQMM